MNTTIIEHQQNENAYATFRFANLSSNMQTYHIITYGCQMNRSDSERIAAIFDSIGLKAIEHADDADVIVVNACSVRQTAIDRIWGNLERFENIKKRHPLFTILTGCVLPSDKPKFQSKFDAIIPMKEIQRLPDILSSFKTLQPSVIQSPIVDLETKNKQKQTVIAIQAKRDVEISDDQQSEIALRNANIDSKRPYNYFTNTPLVPISQNTVSNTYLNLRPKHASRYSAFVPIMTGCNAFCTYCAVPYTRGSEENRKPEEIIQEVEDLVMNKGYKEITLLGQIINKYNSRANDALINYLERFEAKHQITLSFLSELKNSEKRIFRFHHLLETLGNLPRKFWLRFTSSHPNWFTDELIATIRTTPNIPKHVHLPVQSGSDSVLLRMRRPYKIASYLRLIEKIREQIPLAAVTTDCIVGFCGETEEEFEETMRVFQQVRYDMAFIAQYSPRPDTYASKYLNDDVPKSIKKDRERRLNEILRQTALENNQRFIGLTFDVLIHSPLPFPKENTRGVVMSSHRYLGTTENFKNIHVTADRELPIGEFASVKITEANPWGVKGILVG